MNILLLLLLVWISMFLVILVHEMGHALMYRIFFRDKDWHITIGTGWHIIKLKKFTVSVFLTGGAFNYESKNKESKFKYIMMFLGGSLANVIFIVVLRFLLQIITANELTFEQKNLVWFLTFTFWVNVFQFISAIVPMKLPFWPYKDYISDGMKILRKATETS